MNKLFGDAIGESVEASIRYADRLESAGWGGCLRRQMSLGETRQFTRPTSPAPSDVTLCARGGLEAFTQRTKICQGRERRVNLLRQNKQIDVALY